MAYDKLRPDRIGTAWRTSGADSASRLVEAANGDALTASVPILYDANGRVVSTATVLGNTTKFVTHDSGGYTAGNVPEYDANGNLTDSGSTPGGGGSSGFAGILSDVFDWYAANNADNMDHKITSGAYVALIHHDTNATSGYSSPTTATHTVTSGKKAIVLFLTTTSVVGADGGNRGLRLRNTTDSTDIIPQTHFIRTVIGFSQAAGDIARLGEVAAGKALELQTWNISAASRGRGGFVILQEVAA